MKELKQSWGCNNVFCGQAIFVFYHVNFVGIHFAVCDLVHNVDTVFCPSSLLTCFGNPVRNMSDNWKIAIRIPCLN